jgi:hypothetical protein
MRDTPVHGRVPGTEPTYAEEYAELMRLLLVAGLSVGIVAIGLGSRLAMFLLRLTSPDSVVGVESDDGFTIGQFTLGGTYNLVTIGAVAGFIGAVAYVAVAPWLIGPVWLRRLTVGLAAGAVGGALLVHSDGIDFQVLEPLTFAVALFVGLPVLVGVLLAIVADRVSVPGSWTTRDPWRWVVPTVLVALVPLTLFVLAPLAVVVALLLVLRRLLLARLRRSQLATWAVRAGFFTIPVLGLSDLSQTLAELY